MRAVRSPSRSPTAIRASMVKAVGFRVASASTTVPLTASPPSTGFTCSEVLATGAKLETARVDPLALLVRAQRIAVAIAEAKGLDPDAPRALSRAVILDEA